MTTALANANADAHADDVRRAAIGWCVLLCSGDATESDRSAWQRWCGQHPDHQRAWDRLEAIRHSAQQLPAHIAVPTLAGIGRSRRQVLKSFVAIGAAGSLGYLSYRAAPVNRWHALRGDYRTGVGERRAIVLADGSHLLLNTDSSLDAQIDTQSRRLQLWRGEVLVEAMLDARPFSVDTAHGRIDASSRRFIVRADDERTRVAVLDGAVDIRTASGTGGTVASGRQLAFIGDRIGAMRAVLPTIAAWERGSLIVDDWRLGDVVDELARYRRGHLGCDPRVADLRISGAFPIDDTDRALSVLAKSLPVRSSYRTRYWVSVVPA